MKTITKLFLVGLIALGMTACSNEDDIKIEGQPDATVSIRVVPSSNGPVVRAIGDLSNPTPNDVLVAESAIKTLEVYIFDEIQGVQAGYASSTGTEATPIMDGDNLIGIKGIKTTSGPKTIVVVANAPSTIGPKTKDALFAATQTISITEVVIGTTGLPMTGESETVVVAPGDNQYGFKTGDPEFKGTSANQIKPGERLALTRINARVAITSAKLDLPAVGEGEYYIFDGLTDVEVAMFNVPKESKLFVDPLAINANYLHGGLWASPETSYAAGTVETIFFQTVGTNNPLIVNTNAPYFYVNESDGLTVGEQMLIVLRGKPNKGGVPVVAEGLYTDGAGFTYYPVWVNIDGTIEGTGGDGSGKILRNTQYNISLTIKGIGNPTIDPVQDAFLDVLVSVAPWLVVDQTVVWN